MSKHTILIETDHLTSMARVSLDGKVITEGNFWDFHNACYGIYEYGVFQNHVELSTMIYKKLLNDGADFRDIKTIGKYYDYGTING